ncbi:glutamate synthase subunit beta [candidate division KSB1 bacterium]|nr:glutamate synthase subunit beta [candidate division KSB1 bacterium]RQW06131.1 MAG: glutamate synthase subunit beta [candidate division KSB1 bacterium]
MAKATGFLEYIREEAPKRLVHQRVRDYNEFEQLLPEEKLARQAARCMDCGVPSCHSYGCPVQNRIPDFNDLVYRNHWRRALDVLHATNNFPEVTGRVCPAPCETACTLGINQPPVTIKHIELQIIERGFREGWVIPEIPSVKTGKRVAIVGSGPAGLAAAQQLARAGHEVVLMERADRIGGLLRYGIPDFKMEKRIIDRRLQQMADEGVIFETGVEVGKDLSVRYLQRSFDAVLIAAGATVPRDLDLPGRDLDGVHFAMDFLTQQNKVNAGDTMEEQQILAKDKHVIVIGGGDTGSDCVGTSIRQAARSVTQIELLPRPPQERLPRNPWPEWPTIYRTSTSHQEGCERDWSILTKAFEGKGGQVTKIKGVKLDWRQEKDGKWTMTEIPGSDFELKADLVLLAMGFTHVEPGPLMHDYGLNTDQRGNVIVDDNMMTSEKGVFAAGDTVLGASLVVRAIYQGRRAAAGVNAYLRHS